MDMENTKIKKEVSNIFDDLFRKWDMWAEDVVEILDTLSTKATGDVSFEFINRKLKRQINKWYEIMDDAFDDTEELLYRHNLTIMPAIIENHIIDKYGPILEDYKDKCVEISDQYKVVTASSLDEEVVEEFLTISKGMTMEIMLNILKERIEDERF